MGTTLQRTLMTLAAGTLFAAAAWAGDFQSPDDSEGLIQVSDELEAQAGDCDVACDAYCGDCNTGCLDPCGLRSNVYAFFAGDGWANQTDDNGPNNFGFRFGLNSGMPLLSDQGIGIQIGASAGLYDLLGRHDGALQSVEDQTIVTGGIFKRSEVCCGDRVSWAVVYDYQFHNNFAENGQDYISLGQFRALIGYALDAQNEIGFWMTQTDGDEDAIPESVPPGQDRPPTVATTVEPVNQYNLFWHRHWELGGDTMLYAGVAEDPGEFVVGLDGRVPLNCRWSLFYGLHYIKPSADAGHPQFEEEIWNVTGGLIFFPGGNSVAKTVSGNRWLPLLPVADNGTFALDQDP